MKKHDTEPTMMASEFYVLSQLWLRNMPATLSLGRRKSIDIFVETRRGIKTIDVKGIHMHGIGDKWPIGKKDWTGKKDHFFILVRWGEKLGQAPEIWVVPASKAEELKEKWLGGAYAIYYKNEKLKEYKDRWDLLRPGEKDG